MTTRAEIEQMRANINPETYHIEGFARMKNAHFDMPLISHIKGNLWTGGCIDKLQLKDDFVSVISMYPWEKYTLGPNTRREEVEMYDSSDLRGDVVPIAQRALVRVIAGKTLIHCQAGLNRSGLIGGLVLIMQGMKAVDAIKLLREKRSPAVLCNQAFEDFLLAFNPQGE